MRRLGALAAACRRILLLLGLCLSLLLFWAYHNAPSLDSLRPQVELLLKQELRLSRLSLGHLSWYWAGHTYIQAKPVSLTSGGGRLDVQHASLLVRISTWDLLRGDFRASSIRFKGGRVRLAPAAKMAPPMTLPALHVALEDVDLDWRLGELDGKLEQLSLQLDAEAQRLDLHAPGLNLRLGWTAALRPKLLHVRFEDMHWLPRAWRAHLTGDSSGEVSAEKKGGDWVVRLALWARNTAVLALNATPSLPFRQLQAEARLRLPADGIVPEQVEIERLSWRDGESLLELAGAWRQGRLEARLNSGQLALSTLWPWLAGLGEEIWRAWLASMHKGWAYDLTGSLSLAWPKLTAAPALAAWQQARFALHGKVRDADITLDVGGKPLTAVHGEVTASDQGLTAEVLQAQLPFAAGEVKGRLRIRDWQAPLLEVDGSGTVELDRLQRWLDINPMAALHWRTAKARGRFSLAWMPEESEPRQGHAVLVPLHAWQARLLDIPFEVDEGRIIWDATGGIRAENIAFTTELLKGRLFAHSLAENGGKWRLASLKLNGQGDFAGLIARLKLPVRAAAGSLQAELVFDGRWRLTLDLTRAAWEHFLGAHKQSGASFFFHALGEQAGEHLRLRRFTSSGRAMSLAGSGTIGLKDWHLDIRRLVTPAGDIAVSIHSPPGTAPVTVDIDAEYFDEGFLPDPLPRQTIGAKPWLLHVRAKRVQWGSADLRGIDLTMTSANLGIGLLHANRINAANLAIGDVRTVFFRPSAGILDIRSLAANLLGQHLEISAILTLEQGGALRWSGFAQLEGDFTPVVQRLDAAQHFREGEMHALISGRGRLHPARPWWQELQGRLRLRVDHGRILEGGTMTRLLAAASLADLPKLLTFRRKDLIGKGIFYKRLQMEAELNGNKAQIRKLAMRSSALDMAGHGDLDLASGNLDLLMVMRPLQNLDAVIGAIPLLRDVLGGAAHSLLRKVYHVHGPLSGASVEPMEPEEAGLAAPGLIERLLTWPSTWFGGE